MEIDEEAIFPPPGLLFRTVSFYLSVVVQNYHAILYLHWSVTEYGAGSLAVHCPVGTNVFHQPALIYCSLHIGVECVV